jgi:guanylate kinase
MKIDQRQIERVGCLFIVSGPSGAGKTSICTPALAELEDIHPSVSVTTRMPRGDEVDGVDYRFVDEPVFERMRDAGEFAEWAEVHGNCYATPRRAIEDALAAGRDLLLDIDVQGAEQVKTGYPDAVSVFLLPPSRDRLRERLERRGTESAEKLSERLANACEEIAALRNYDYLIVNEELEFAVEEFISILRGERQRVARLRDDSVRGILDSFGVKS